MLTHTLERTKTATATKLATGMEFSFLSFQRFPLKRQLFVRQPIELILQVEMDGEVADINWRSTIVDIEFDRILVAISRPVLYQKIKHHLGRGAEITAKVTRSFDGSQVIFQTKVYDHQKIGTPGIWLTIPDEGQLEQRAHDRVTLVRPVTIHSLPLNDSSQTFNGSTVNLSCSGLRVVSPYRFLPGEKVMISFELSSQEKPLEIPCSAIYSEPASCESMPVNRSWFSTALEFDNLDETQSKIIEAFCQNYYLKQLKR